MLVEVPPEEETPGWMRRLGRRVAALLKRFRAAVDRKPWLSLAYKITIAIIGSIVILAGLVMLVTPGPGWVTIFLGLAIMGSEFPWARRILTWLRAKVAVAADRWRRWRSARAEAKQEQSPAAHSD